MNILLLSQFFSTTKGGGEYVFKTIAQVMAQNGHKVWVITNKVKDEKYKELENLKIITVNPTIQYKGGLPPTFLDNIRYTINAFQKGKKIINDLVATGLQTPEGDPRPGGEGGYAEEGAEEDAAGPRDVPHGQCGSRAHHAQERGDSEKSADAAGPVHFWLRVTVRNRLRNPTPVPTITPVTTPHGGDSILAST